MDEIFPTPIQLHSQIRTRQMFLDLCNDQAIFCILYDFLGCAAYFQLAATNSKLKSAIEKHESIQVKILKVKIKKLKFRQLKRSLPIYLWVDFNLFNPFALPPYQQNHEDMPEQDSQQTQKQKVLIENKTFGDNDPVKIQQWNRWKNRRAYANNKKNLAKKQIPKNNGKVKNQMEKTQDQKRQQTLKKAEMMYQATQQIKRRLIEQYPHAQKNQIQAMRNRHFFQKFVTTKDLQSYHQNRRKSKPKPKIATDLDDQFYLACSDEIKSKQMNRLISKINNPKPEQFSPNPIKVASKLAAKGDELFNYFANFLKVKPKQASHS